MNSDGAITFTHIMLIGCIAFLVGMGANVLLSCLT